MDSTAQPTSGFSSSIRTWLLRLSILITDGLETGAFKWGLLVASNPCRVIAICLALTLSLSAGLLRFQEERRPERNWMPQASRYMRDFFWINDNFPSPLRHQLVIVTSRNVLEPHVIEQIIDLQWAVTNITVEAKNGSTLRWDDLCGRIPEVKLGSYSILGPDFDPTSLINSGFYSLDKYCSLLQSLDSRCWARGLAELFTYEEDEPPGNRTLPSVLESVNSVKYSPLYGLSTNFSEFLGRIRRSPESGLILGAEAALLHFATVEQKGGQDVLSNVAGSAGSSLSHPTNLAWEEKFVELVLRHQFKGDVKAFVQATKSFADVTERTLWQDVPLLGISIFVMCFFVFFSIGKLNCVEHRLLLSFAGICSIALAVLSTISLCSLLGIRYTPAHNILTLLLLGLGVDDMFVLVQCWNNLRPASPLPSLPMRIAETLKRSGVAITVTSMTDFVAFTIGSSTVLPALESFCLYAAVGILCTYFLQNTFFLACFTLDQKRIEARLDGVFCCPVVSCSGASWTIQDVTAEGFRRFIPTYLFLWPVRILVVLVALVSLGVNVFGVVRLRQQFELIWFVPSDAYIARFFNAYQQYFPEHGLAASAYFGPSNLSSTFPSLLNATKNLDASLLVMKLEDWPAVFLQWNKDYYASDLEKNSSISESEMQLRLSRFLTSPTGGKFQKNFHFSEPLICGKELPPLTAFRVDFHMISPKSSLEKVATMDALRGIVDHCGYDGTHFTWSFYFSGWETDRFISGELWNNLLLDIACIFLVTLLLIAHPTASLGVLAMVVLTLFWGLTIEVVTSLNLILSVGLSVDYAAHTAHAFMHENGGDEPTLSSIEKRTRRARAALESIGPAVLKGGVSTFLSFLFLAYSASYVFQVFFKVFFLTCLYGLYNGLFLLPVCLSVIGPAPIKSARGQQHKSACLRPCWRTKGLDVTHSAVADSEGVVLNGYHATLSLSNGVATQDSNRPEAVPKVLVLTTQGQRCDGLPEAVIVSSLAHDPAAKVKASHCEDDDLVTAV